MLTKSVFTLLCALLCFLFYVIGFWRKKAGEAAYATAWAAMDEKECDRYCRLSVTSIKIRKMENKKEVQLIELHLFSYGCLLLFIVAYFTSSKSASCTLSPCLFPLCEPPACPAFMSGPACAPP